MGFNITLNINKLLKDLGEFVKEAIIQKNITQFEKDLYHNLNIFRNLSRNESLKKALANDPLLKKELAKVKTSVMETISKWQYLYRGIRSGENSAFFTDLQIALYKINELKEINALSAQQIKKRPKHRVVVRVKNIITFLCKLTKKTPKAER